MADESNKVEIKIDAGGDGAVVAIERVRNALRGFGDTVLTAGRTIGRFMRAFARLNWIVASVQLLVSWVQQLREWTNRAATAKGERR